MTCAAQSAPWDPFAGSVGSPRATPPRRRWAIALLVAVVACAAWSRNDTPAPVSTRNASPSRIIALLRADDPLPATRETRASLPVAESLGSTAADLERATGL
jgi:hypothetical protein